MPFEKLIEFEYVHQIDKKKLATIILLVTLGFGMFEMVFR